MQTSGALLCSGFPPFTLSGNPGDDAKPYQERQVEAAIEESLK